MVTQDGILNKALEKHITVTRDHDRLVELF